MAIFPNYCVTIFVLLSEFGESTRTTATTRNTAVAATVTPFVSSKVIGGMCVAQFCTCSHLFSAANHKCIPDKKGKDLSLAAAKECVAKILIFTCCEPTRIACRG